MPTLQFYNVVLFYFICKEWQTLLGSVHSVLVILHKWFTISNDDDDSNWVPGGTKYSS